MGECLKRGKHQHGSISDRSSTGTLRKQIHNWSSFRPVRVHSILKDSRFAQKVVNAVQCIVPFSSARRNRHKMFVRLRFSPFYILFITRLLPLDESTSCAEWGVVFCNCCVVFFIVILTVLCGTMLCYVVLCVVVLYVPCCVLWCNLYHVLCCGAIRTVLRVVAKLRMTRRVTVHYSLLLCSKDGAGDKAKDKSSCVKDSFVKGKDKTEDTKICRSREEGQCSKG